jgi:Mg/Co/Ni transporter MgtE
VVGETGVLAGALSLADLVRVDPAAKLCDLIEEAPTPTVGTEADLPEVARLMADYNLVALPVLDAEGRPVGMIAVDDVLELLLPEEWRRRAGIARS